MDQILAGRKMVVDYYDEQIIQHNIQKLKIREGTEWNYSYYPVIFESEERLLQVQKRLNEINIFPRRYFYPSLNKINYLNKGEMPISESISKRILCLPLFDSISQKTATVITNVVNNID